MVTWSYSLGYPGPFDIAEQCGGFGTMTVGSGPFGTGYIDPFLEVLVFRRNSVDVYFSFPPSLSDPATYWDLLNPRNWTLITTDGVPRLIQYVERLTETSARVFFDGELSFDAEYMLSISPSARDLYLMPVPFICPSMPFQMVQQSEPDLLTQAGVTDQNSRFDIANPFTASNAPQNAPLSTYQIDDTGDVANDTGLAYLRKRIIRRATTLAGQFFHLPQYGFAEPLKGLLSASELQRMRSLAVQQIKLEPDVRTVSVTAYSPSPGIAILDIKVEDSFGNQVSAVVPINFGDV